MNKNAFTLIELLAVIVILAIIALIAVPVVINIINNSKKSSEEQTVELYMDSVKKAIARKQLEVNNFNPNECTIKEDGNLKCANIEVSVDMKGIKPNKGIIEIKDNKLTYKNLLLNGQYYNKLANLVQDNNNNGKPDIGDKYTYKVNEKDTFNFYVLSFNDDDTVNLIMDRNICNDGTVNYTSTNNYCKYKWHLSDDNSNGPITVMTELYKGTKDWDNVPNMYLNYFDEGRIEFYNRFGYGTIETTLTGIKIIMKDGETEVTRENNQIPIIPYENGKLLKARLPKYSEVNEAECISSNLSCPSWLVENLAYWSDVSNKYSVNSAHVYGTATHNIGGYWLLSSTPGNTTFARRVYWGGSVGNDSIVSTSYGIRPVITVPIDYL